MMKNLTQYISNVIQYTFLQEVTMVEVYFSEKQKNDEVEIVIKSNSTFASS